MADPKISGIEIELAPTLSIAGLEIELAPTLSVAGIEIELLPEGRKNQEFISGAGQRIQRGGDKAFAPGFFS